MVRFRINPEPKHQSDISRAQVARFIRRMAVVSEGNARLVRVLEDADGLGLSMKLPKTIDKPRDAIAIYSACKAIIAVVAATPYDGVQALHAVRRSVALAPDHVKSAAQMPEDAVLNTINRSDTAHDGLACYALIRLVIEMELDILRTAN